MSPTPTSTTAKVDVRGPRFAAWVTTAVLVLTLIVSASSVPTAAAVLGAQAVVFAVGAWAGPRRHPYGLVFAKLVAPRLGPVSEREPVAPLKFAQLVGFVFSAVGVAGFVVGAALLGVVATAAALSAAFLNAAFGICLGCQLYPLVVRLRPGPQTSEAA
ncbi:MAG: DUF4395 domain-containing protein [Mycobacterium sp.]